MFCVTTHLIIAHQNNIIITINIRSIDIECRQHYTYWELAIFGVLLTRNPVWFINEGVLINYIL